MEHTPPEGVSTLKRIPNPAQLSESVRARLEQRAALHAADLAQGAQGVAAAPPVTQPAVPVQGALPDDAPLRRGEARQRRVQAVDTEEGVTVLSNRLVLPDPRLALTAQRTVAAEPDPEPPVEEDEALALSEPASVTETHSLRTLGSRPAPSNPVSAGLGWLVWPFVLFLLGGAVVGTLWFRKKTE